MSPIKSAAVLSIAVALFTFTLLPADIFPDLLQSRSEHENDGRTTFQHITLNQNADPGTHTNPGQSVIAGNTFLDTANDSSGSSLSVSSSMISEPDSVQATVNSSEWTEKLYRRLTEIDSRFSGEVGVYVKDLDSGQTVSFRGDENWYLASGIKVPVAIAVMQGVERGEYTLDTELELKATDYVDGAGRTNWSPPGTRFSIRHLLEESLLVSDNTASDLLIRLVGIENVNSLVANHVSEFFGDITTLADVRRHAYSGFHERAFDLTGYDFIKLRQESEEQRRKETLAAILGINVQDFVMPDMDSVFEAYYESNLNGGRLSAFGDLLEKMTSDHLLESGSRDYLMEIMRNIKTGDNRIRAALPESMVFAHKTGTQRGRTCDLGITGEQGSKRVIIAACTRGTLRTQLAEQALREVGEAVWDSGLFPSETLTEVQP